MKTTDEMIKNVFERKKKYEMAKKAQHRRMWIITSAISCMCVVLTLFTLVAPRQNNESSDNAYPIIDEAYQVIIDVNPSILCRANEKDIVIEASGLNNDGEELLKESDLEGKPINDAVKELAEAMVDRGYISEEANSMLVSVEGAEDDKDQNIKDNLAESISKSLAAKELEGAIILQTIPQNSELNKIAQTYNISVGKAQLISQIVEQNKMHSIEELSAMSIHELNVLKISYYVEMENTNEVGTPGYMAYIGEDRAKEIALTNANANTDTIETQLDCSEGTMVYRVEFEDSTHDFRYYVNAVTGEILSADKHEIGETNFPEKETDIGFVGENAALKAALTHAGMTDSILTWCKYERDWINGVSVYNLFFTDGRISGRYVVDARTGEIIQNSITKEYHDRSINADVIGETTAKQIALSKDGLIDGNVSKYEIKLYEANNSYVYELSFICNGIKYNVQIDAINGTVLIYEKNNLRDTGSPSVEEGTHVSAEEGTPVPDEAL